ncbi:MAG: hypothetical protein QXJ81_06145, partial [Metallosphaera sp.]
MVLEGRIVVFSDTGFPINPVNALITNLYYWNWPAFPGGSTYAGSYIEAWAVASFFYLMFKNTGLSQYFTLLTFTYISSIGIYFIVSLILNSERNYLTYFSALVAGLFYVISPIYTFDFVSNLSGYIYSYSMFPLFLYFVLKYINSDRWVSLTLLGFITATILFSLGISFGTPPILWWELVTSIVILIILSIFKIIKFYIKKFLIVLITLIVSFIPFVFSYFNNINNIAYSVTHSTFDGKSLIQYILQNTFLIMSIRNYEFSYYTAEYSFTLMQGDMIYLLLLPFVLILVAIISSRDHKITRLLSFLFLYELIIEIFASGLINPLIITNIINNSVTVGIAYSFQNVYSLYPLSLVYSILFGLSFYYILSNIRRIRQRMAIIFLFALVFISIMTPISIRPPINTYSAFGYPNVTSLTPVIPPLVQLTEFLNSQQDSFNVLIAPVQWAAYAYNNSVIISNPVIFGSMILPPSEKIVGGVGGLVDPILTYFPNSKYNFTNYFLLLGIKYVIVNTHAYPGFGAVLNPPYANGFSQSLNQFNISGMENVLKKEGAVLVANYSLFEVYQLANNVNIIYASNGIPYNFSSTNATNNLFFLYANNTLKVYNTSLVCNEVEINNITTQNVHVNYQYINPDLYLVHINASTKFYLIFDQGYSKNWYLIYPNGSVNNDHYLANGYSNAWLIPRGSYNIKIEYIPEFPIFYYEKFIYFSMFFIISILLVIKKFIKYTKF